jgi:hypothetical protein
MSSSLKVMCILCAVAGLLFFFEAHAKIAPATLSELVKRSKTIVCGDVVSTADSGQRKDMTDVPFNVSKVLKGAAALTSQQILLCKSPPPMVDYPDVSKLTGDNVLFVVERTSGCFELTRGYRSIVSVRDNRASTQHIEHQPPDQPLKLLFQKIGFLVSSTGHLGQ